MRVEIKELERHEDERGCLIEVLKGEDMKHLYFSISHTGAIRGNHYHKRKVEWFCVIKGMAKLLLEDNNSKERKELCLSGENPKIVTIFPNVTHAIENIGDDDTYLIVVANEVFDPKDPDTF